MSSGNHGLKVRPRPRAGSFQEALEEIENDPKHHIAGSLAPQSPTGSSHGSPPPMFPIKRVTPGFWEDIVTMKWMITPSSSFKMLVLPLVLYVMWALILPQRDNPWSRLIFVSNRVPDTPEGYRVYAKSYWDILFVAYYIIVFSFIRQSLTIYALKPIARHYGIRKPAKVDRFAEQGYAVVYFTASGLLGLWTMYHYLPTWFFRVEYFWINYPHWGMVGTLKSYYLLQTAYWCQQFFLLVLRVEKPRSDFTELIAHHLVTLWLIIWSYLFSLTLIGNAIYLTMDWSDVFLALSKCFNYLQMEKTKTIAFAWFTCVWTYLRHYLNLVILWSVWFQFDLMPHDSKVWDPENGKFLPPAMKYQIFIPIAALQVINLFWYFLIWRILLRAIFSANLDDERSDNEDEGDEPEKKGN